MKNFLIAATMASLLLPSSVFAFQIGSGGSLKIANTAQGTRDASEFGKDIDSEQACTGFVGEVPSMAVEIKNHGVYHIRVESSDDLTLVVKTKDEVYCNDDTSKKDINPSVTVSKPGEIQIYIGTKEKNKKVKYTLVMADSAG